MNRNIEKIFGYLSIHLSPKIFKHSYNVAVLAGELALRYSIDILKARSDGILHDCAKGMTDKELINFFKRRHKGFKYYQAIIRFSPHLLHSFAGEIIAKENLKIKDCDILNAIKNHTQGRENMSVLEK
ncbi:MAG: bis(5'-nucleosyl)-tetraphosphatase (symmetrical) YqeK [Endomicrobium sp.]|jgi:predicted HD superfamily hydrolase involved in NAD metabolism|nr:bis(5'-nucleosyl)-tetraphosphatase (symmetrical) YqeK [Endomicrobium sp.]